MKTSIIFTTLLFSLLFISCNQEQSNSIDIYSQIINSDDLDCEKEELKVVAIIAELGKFRSSNETPLSSEDDEKIRAFVEQLRNKKEDLIVLAKLTRTLSMNAGTDECIKSRLEESYSRAFWYAIEILAQDRSEKNLEELKRLKEEFKIDGGDSYDWSTIVDRVPAP